MKLPYIILLLALGLKGLFAPPQDFYNEGNYGGDMVPQCAWYRLLINATNKSVVNDIYFRDQNFGGLWYYFGDSWSLNPYRGSIRGNCSVQDLWLTVSQTSKIGNGINGTQSYGISALMNNPNGKDIMYWVRWFTFRTDVIVMRMGYYFNNFLTGWWIGTYSPFYYPGKGVNQANLPIMDPTFQSTPETNYSGWNFGYGNTLFNFTGWSGDAPPVKPDNGDTSIKKLSTRSAPRHDLRFLRFYTCFLAPTNTSNNNAAQLANQATMQLQPDPQNSSNMLIILTRNIGPSYTFEAYMDDYTWPYDDPNPWVERVNAVTARFKSPLFGNYGRDFPSMMNPSTSYSGKIKNFVYLGKMTEDVGKNGQIIETPMTYLVPRGNSYVAQKILQPQTSINPNAAATASNPTAYRLTVINYTSATPANALKNGIQFLKGNGWINLADSAGTASGGGSAPIDFGGAFSGLMPSSISTAALLTPDNQFMCALFAMPLPTRYNNYPTAIISQVTFNQSGRADNTSASSSASVSTSSSSSSSASSGSSSSSSSSSSTSSGYPTSASSSASASSSSSTSSSSSVSASSSASASASSSSSASDSSSASASTTTSSSTSSSKSTGDSNSVSVTLTSSLSSGGSSSSSTSASNSSSSSLSSSASSGNTPSTSASDGESSSTSTGKSTGTANSASVSLTSSQSSGDNMSASASLSSDPSNSKESKEREEEGGNGHLPGIPENQERLTELRTKEGKKMGAPFPLSANETQQGNIKLIWNYPNKTSPGFIIEYQDLHSNNQTWKRLSEVPGDQSSYEEKAPASSYSYLYRVRSKGTEDISMTAKITEEKSTKRR